MATITNVTELQAMKDDLAGNYILDRNIDASPTAGWNAGLGFEPVGSLANPFIGTLNMAGYTIHNLYVNRPLAGTAGLFGYTSGATIINGILADVDIIGVYAHSLAYQTLNTIITNIKATGTVTGGGYTAGLVGLAGMGTIITDCNTAVVVLSNGGGSPFVGGLVAVLQGATLIRCYAISNVTAYGEVRAGALVGVMDVHTATDTVSSLSQCYALGNVIGYDDNGNVGGYLGALVGWMGENGKSGCTISNSYARGNVSVETPASAESGGLVGHIDDNDDVVEYSYSTGTVPGAGTVGGLVGYRRPDSTLTACFWDTETSGTADGVGNGAETGATGAITYLMKLQSTFTNAAWDFDTIWSINGVRNDGYPFHLAILPDALPDSPRTTSEEPVQDKITLELIRNVEMASGGHFRTDEEGNAVYKSRYARNP